MNESRVIPIGGMIVSLFAVVFIAFGSYRAGRTDGVAQGREVEHVRLIRGWGDVRPPIEDR